MNNTTNNEAPNVNDLERSEAEIDEFFDADQTVIQLKAGQVITEEILRDIRLVTKWYAENDERATDAFDRGFQYGRDQGGGKEVGDLLRQVDALKVGLNVTKVVAGMRESDLLKALQEMVHAVCGPTGFASAVRGVTGTAYPWPELDIAEEKARAAISKALSQGGGK